MHLQNLQTVTVTHVNLVKIELTGGKISKILQIIDFEVKCSQVLHIHSG